MAKSSAARSETSLNVRTPKESRAIAEPSADGALPQFDRIIHERIRLGLVSALAVNESLTFNELKKLLRTTDGNLSVHARRLEEAQYISCTKSFEGRMPKTEYRLTTTGKKMFEKYLSHMEALIEVVRDR